MLERLWTSILEIMAQFVTPDWAALIALIPVAIAVIVVAVLARTFLMLAKAPPARRGKQPIAARTPAGIHMPGPSWAPVFAAIGVALLFLGLVFNGVILVLGIIALLLTLLYWLAEGLRIYDHDLGVDTVTTLPAVVHDGPPPGVHMPGPSFRPIMGAIGVALLMAGLVFGGWILLAGVIALISTLVGWLVDARKEYVKTVEADTTGHLENIPPPRTPSTLLYGLTVVVVIALFLQSVVFSTNPANATPGTSGVPEASAGGGGGAPPSQGPTADVTVEAKGVAFVQKAWTAPAGKPFTIAFDNEDPGTPHNIEIKDGGGASVFKGEIFNGVATKVYDVPALTAGAYTFVCTVHPTMTGTATLQ